PRVAAAPVAEDAEAALAPVEPLDGAADIDEYLVAVAELLGQYLLVRRDGGERRAKLCLIRLLLVMLASMLLVMLASVLLVVLARILPVVLASMLFVVLASGGACGFCFDLREPLRDLLDRVTLVVVYFGHARPKRHARATVLVDLPMDEAGQAHDA